MQRLERHKRSPPDLKQPDPLKGCWRLGSCTGHRVMHVRADLMLLEGASLKALGCCFVQQQSHTWPMWRSCLTPSSSKSSSDRVLRRAAVDPQQRHQPVQRVSRTRVRAAETMSLRLHADAASLWTVCLPKRRPAGHQVLRNRCRDELGEGARNLTLQVLPLNEANHLCFAAGGRARVRAKLASLSLVPEK